jgi:hypothetical protein
LTSAFFFFSASIYNFIFLFKEICIKSLKQWEVCKDKSCVTKKERLPLATAFEKWKRGQRSLGWDAAKEVNKEWHVKAVRTVESVR